MRLSREISTLQQAVQSCEGAEADAMARHLAHKHEVRRNPFQQRFSSFFFLHMFVNLTRVSSTKRHLAHKHEVLRNPFQFLLFSVNISGLDKVFSRKAPPRPQARSPPCRDCC